MLGAGPSLMFITLPKVFASMAFGRVFAIMFFFLVLFAALTSSIALAECAVSTFTDEWHLSRQKGTILLAVIMVVLGTLSTLGYGPLDMIKILGMQFLDFFDFITNSIMMPISAFFICMYTVYEVTVKRIADEVELNGEPFKRKKIFNFMVRYVAPIFVLVILAASILSVLGIITV